MEALGLAEHPHAAVYSVHLPRIFGRGYCPDSRVAEAEKSGSDDDCAVGDADRPAARTAQQLNVILPVLLPSTREDDLASSTPHDAVALHRSPRFFYVQVGGASE